MSTHANGMQQTYQEIWASMEASCTALLPSIQNKTAVAPVRRPLLERSGAGVFQSSREQAHRSARRSARARRRTAAGRGFASPTAA